MQKRDYPRGEANFFVLLSVGCSLCSPPTPEPNCGFSFDDEVDLLFHFFPFFAFWDSSLLQWHSRAISPQYLSCTRIAMFLRLALQESSG
ncbi:hypothetical protein L5515_001038 [Caenorhabditis briggsae]|uniref:Uncharacterized protein n=1 Tax=Caenorhabditis briggsae TaxID=6238 RepID=A0AAE9J2S9_CAEBR|nr:hypothetical protein L5515_001038 [Caenorhabditis briggsae]